MLIGIIGSMSSSFFLYGSMPSVIMRFKHLTQQDGLSQNSIFSILEDHKGFMWFGTQDGLNMYDGYHFTVFRPDPDNENSISFNDVSVLIETRDGEIWIGTRGGGLNRYDRRTRKFYHYRYHKDNPDGISSDYLNSICEDEAGNLWIGTDDSGFDRLHRKDGTFEHFRKSLDGQEGISDDRIARLFLDSRGMIWIATYSSGLHRFDPVKREFRHYLSAPASSQEIGMQTIRAIYEDHSGEMWLGTAAGLVLFDRDNGNFILYNHNPHNPNSLSSNLVHTIFEDHSGVLWVGTILGLNRFDRRTEQFICYKAELSDGNSLSSNVISTVYEGRSGTLWVGTFGGGINKFDREGEKFKTYRSHPDHPGKLIYAICKDRRGQLWLGTDTLGVLVFNRKDGVYTSFHQRADAPGPLKRGTVHAIFEDDQGDMWIGSSTAAVICYHPDKDTFDFYQYSPEKKEGFSRGNIMACLQDKAGQLWFATTVGLSCYHRDKDNFSHYHSFPEVTATTKIDDWDKNYTISLCQGREGHFWLATGSGLNAFDPKTCRFVSPAIPSPDQTGNNGKITVMSVYEDPEGRVWLGTFGQGLKRYDPGTRTYIHYNEKHGLPNNVVYSVLPDSQGNYWISTNGGLSCFNPRTNTFKNYNIKDGLQSNEFNIGSYFKSSDGEMFFGGVNGFNAFYPAYIRDNPHIPPVVITDFQVFNQSMAIGCDQILTHAISETEEIRLSYKQNVISFEFVALDYTIPEKNLYAYKLEGFDQEWVYTTAQKRFASYTNLDPGEYRFLVKGSNNDGVWNHEGASVNIIISPPMWRTWWFQILSVLVVVSLIGIWYQQRMRSLSQKMRLETEMRTAHDAQMSIMPQFDPKVPGFDISGICVPANEVGGDFFDYIWLNEAKTRFGIAIGDVSGKAMKAAMTAVMADGILYSKADESESIKEIMTRVNRPIYFKTDRKMFTALCMASLNLPTLELTFTNAGLNHPLLKSGLSVTALKSEGPKFPLGIKKDNIYQETYAQLKKGDILVLFTDGLPETANLQGQFFGIQQLISLLEKMDTASLSAAQIKKNLVKEARNFSSPVSQQDDITIVVVKVL